jgi:molybdopterin converting factor small subunit
MTEFRVRLFAAHREAAGRPWVDLQLPEGATVGDLCAALRAAVPRAAALTTVVAVDGEFVGDGARLKPGADVAVFPPVAGG